MAFFQAFGNPNIDGILTGSGGRCRSSAASPTAFRRLSDRTDTGFKVTLDTLIGGFAADTLDGGTGDRCISPVAVAVLIGDGIRRSQ
jgi:hypothetical protein